MGPRKCFDDFAAVALRLMWNSSNDKLLVLLVLVVVEAIAVFQFNNLKQIGVNLFLRNYAYPMFCTLVARTGCSSSSRSWEVVITAQYDPEI